MGLRPARTVRAPVGQIWARFSHRKPRKSFVKGAPHSKIRQYNMGTDKRFEIEVEVVAEKPVQLRDNSIEASRQAANKYLERALVDNYFLQVVSYPHGVVREHAALGVAGADRISKGMKRAFGKPKGRLARLRAGYAVFRARLFKKDLPALKEALRRARSKLSGKFVLVTRDITQDKVNLLRSIIGRKMKKKEEIKPVAEAAAAEAAPAEVTEAAKEGAAEAEAKKEEKAPAKKK